MSERSEAARRLLLRCAGKPLQSIDAVVAGAASESLALHGAIGEVAGDAGLIAGAVAVRLGRRGWQDLPSATPHGIARAEPWLAAAGVQDAWAFVRSRTTSAERGRWAMGGWLRAAADEAGSVLEPDPLDDLDPALQRVIRVDALVGAARRRDPGVADALAALDDLIAQRRLSRSAAAAYLAAWSVHDPAQAEQRLARVLKLAPPDYLQDAVPVWVRACLGAGADPLSLLSLARFFSERVLVGTALLEAGALAADHAHGLLSELMEEVWDEAEPDQELLVGMPLLMSAAVVGEWELASSYALQWRVPAPVLVRGALAAEAAAVASRLLVTDLVEELLAVSEDEWNPTFAFDDAWWPTDPSKRLQACEDVLQLVVSGAVNRAAPRRLWGV